MKTLRLILVVVALTLLGALAAHYYLVTRGPSVTRQTVNVPAMLREVQALQELATVKYTIQKVIGLEEQKTPFGSESVLMVVLAHVKAGVDLRTLTPQDVAVSDARAVTLRLPPPKILDVYIDDQQTKVYQRSKTWWTPWVPDNPQLEQQARVAALEAVQLAATQSGILSNAQVNTETALRAFLRLTGFHDVTFTAH